MKRFLILLAIMVVALSAAGCGADSPTTTLTTAAALDFERVFLRELIPDVKTLVDSFPETDVQVETIAEVREHYGLIHSLLTKWEALQPPTEVSREAYDIWIGILRHMDAVYAAEAARDEVRAAELAMRLDLGVEGQALAVAMQAIANGVGIDLAAELDLSPATTTTTPATAETTTPMRRTPAGVSTVDDPAGDVADPDGRMPPSGLGSSGDLRSVSLEADATSLVITFESVAPPPSTTAASSLGGSEYMLWCIRTAAPGGDWQYQVEASLLGSEWHLSVYDLMSAVQSNQSGEPTVTGNTLVMTFPLSSMPLISEATAWYAIVEWSDGFNRYEDSTKEVPTPWQQ